MNWQMRRDRLIQADQPVSQNEETSRTTLIKVRWIKIGIGSLVMIMMLGTALFSIQAFTGNFHPSSFRYSADNLDESVPDSSVQNEDPKSMASDSDAPADSSSHSMNSSAETKGFLAVPWIPAGYIRQAMAESSLSHLGRKSLRGFVLMDYPFHDTITITDSTVRSRSNSDYSIQILTLDISRLTAG